MAKKSTASATQIVIYSMNGSPLPESMLNELANRIEPIVQDVAQKYERRNRVLVDFRSI